MLFSIKYTKSYLSFGNVNIIMSNVNRLITYQYNIVTIIPTFTMIIYFFTIYSIVCSSPYANTVKSVIKRTCISTQTYLKTYCLSIKIKVKINTLTVNFW